MDNAIKSDEAAQERRAWAMATAIAILITGNVSPEHIPVRAIWLVDELYRQLAEKETP